MRISVVSGKGGTGKTTISSCLALSSVLSTDLFDYDVESPNLGGFLNRRILEITPVTVPVPEVDQEKCNLCRACLQCRFNAIALVKKKVLIFKDLCRHCGFCSMICPVNAISEVDYDVGKIIKSEGESSVLFTGELNIGENHSEWILMKLNSIKHKHNVQIVDAGPGTGREIYYSVINSDFIVLVTEPVKSALHDLKLIVKRLEKLNKPWGVIINKSGKSDSIIIDFCQQKNIRVLDRIPYSREIAELSSKGLPFVLKYPEYYERFRKILFLVKQEVGS